MIKLTSPGPVFKLSADPRVRRLGRGLRKFSVDEWPQLVNVLRREMSLVGRRPLPVYLRERLHDSPRSQVSKCERVYISVSHVHWFKRLCLPDDYAAATVETICNEFLVLPAKLAKHGSRNVLQLPSDYHHREIFLEAVRKIEALWFPELAEGEKLGLVSSRR